MNTTTTSNASTGGVRVARPIRNGRIGGNATQSTPGLLVKSRVKAGFNFTYVAVKSSPNHNQTAKGLRISSRVTTRDLNSTATKI